MPVLQIVIPSRVTREIYEGTLFHNPNVGGGGAALELGLPVGDNILKLKVVQRQRENEIAHMEPGKTVKISSHSSQRNRALTMRGHCKEAW